jgi:hypothetical protein
MLEHKMQFIKDFLRNICLVIVIGLVLFVIFPDIVGQIFQLYGALFGPATILLIVVFALPRKKRH